MRRANFSAMVVYTCDYAFDGAAAQHNLRKGSLVSTKIDAAPVLLNDGDEIEGAPERPVMPGTVLVYILRHGWSQQPGGSCWSRWSDQCGAKAKYELEQSCGLQGDNTVLPSM